MILLQQFLVLLKHQTFQANLSSILMPPCFKAVTARKIINLYHVASSRLHITQQGHITVQGCILSNSDTMHKSKKGTL